MHPDISIGPKLSPDTQLLEGRQVLIIGRSRSGKSRLATSIATRFSRVLVYDPKDDPNSEIPNAHLATTADDAIQAIGQGTTRILFRPDRETMGDIARELDRILDAIISLVKKDPRKPWCIVIHELGDVASADKVQVVLSELFRQGQGKGFILIVVTQRPTEIPRGSVSESSDVFVFYLRDDEDRKSAARFAGELVRSNPVPRDYSFWYVGPDEQLRHYDRLGA